ncbi:MAG: hypothetical protein OSJ27_04245 [Candidatus Gastranaerophilales bacterium]|nr:hypothetical protein [Candidatus Gastranaerophilales bacterium]
MNSNPLWDKFVAITSYYTFGLTGLIWIIVSYVVFKKPLTPFCSYHIYQSIFISVLLAVFSMLLDIIFQLTVKIPFIGDFIGLFNLYVFKLPIFHTFSLFNLIIFSIITYLSLGALLGKLSYFPFISDVIKSNFRN